MKRTFVIGILFLLLGIGAAALMFSGCADKSSSEACRYETSMNLDKGNYDAVLASPCADALQKGAAYFGKAGFSTTDVINRFIDANSAQGTKSDLKIYLSDMIGSVTDATIGYLESSHTEYSSITTTSLRYRDAQFSLSLVDAIRALSLLKYIIEENTLSALNDTCDANNNTKPDELDATSCALYVSAGQSCSVLNSGGTVTVTDSPNLTFTGKAGTYRGLVVTITGTGPNITGCPSPNSHKRLLFQNGSNVFPVATASTLCAGSDGNQWPCPLTDANGQPIDLVMAIDQSITSSLSALQTSQTTSTDVAQSITDIKTTACPTGTCTSADIATYLQTY